MSDPIAEFESEMDRDIQALNELMKQPEMKALIEAASTNMPAVLPAFPRAYSDEEIAQMVEEDDQIVGRWDDVQLICPLTLGEKQHGS